MPSSAWKNQCGAAHAHLAQDEADVLGYAHMREQGIGLEHRVLFFNDTATTEIYTLSLHDALPILGLPHRPRLGPGHPLRPGSGPRGHLLRSEEHTSELQSHVNLVCRLLLEKT